MSDRWKKFDLAGQKFGRYTVTNYCETRKGHAYWNVVCDCGNKRTVDGGNLRAGGTTSCGCLCRERTSQANTTHGDTLGYNRTREYLIWTNMKNRCHGLRPDKVYYQGRGIIVCERWRNSFSNFLADMGRCPPNMSLDRINNDGNYDPGNCRWATRQTQMENRRITLKAELNGEEKTLKEWSKIFGIQYYTLRFAIVYRGEKLKDFLSRQLKKEKVYAHP